MRQPIIVRAFILVLLIAFSLSACNLSQDDTAPSLDLPQVIFVEPGNNARVIAGTDLTIDIYATDVTVGIARIEFRIDGATYKDGAPANYGVENQFRVQMNWVAEGVGLHIFSAIAYRPDGTRSDETFITVEVVTE